jgi:hypothetical protein
MGAKVGVAALLIAILLTMALGVPGTDHGGFREGVQNSEECRANPDNWWCKLWGSK